LVKKEYLELKTNLTNFVMINNHIRFAYKGTQFDPEILEIFLQEIEKM
jgi:response regulator RpfG family c-di-GMP phosphodiesterase